MARDQQHGKLLEKFSTASKDSLISSMLLNPGGRRKTSTAPRRGWRKKKRAKIATILRSPDIRYRKPSTLLFWGPVSRSEIISGRAMYLVSTERRRCSRDFAQMCRVDVVVDTGCYSVRFLDLPMETRSWGLRLHDGVLSDDMLSNRFFLLGTGCF